MQIPYSTAVFLAAYTNQAALSLDRVIWDRMDELRKFYSHQISPNQVAELIAQSGKTKSSKAQKCSPTVPPNFINRLLLTLKRWVGVTNMQDEDWQCLHSKLIEFNALLNSQKYVNGFDFSHEIVPLRLWLSFFYWNKLVYFLKSADYKKTANVEHFNQALHIERIPLKYFLTPPPLPPFRNNK